MIRLSGDPMRRTWRRGDGPNDGDSGSVSRMPARPQTMREKEMSPFGKRNAKPRAKSERGSDVTA